jgi:hypothetical protein
MIHHLHNPIEFYRKSYYKAHLRNALYVQIVTDWCNLHHHHVLYLQIVVTWSWSDTVPYLHVYRLYLSFADCKLKIAAFQVTTSTVKYYDLVRFFPKRF